MAHGGARINAGRKAKFHDWEGQPLQTKRQWIPVVLSDADIQQATLIKLSSLLENQNDDKPAE